MKRIAIPALAILVAACNSLETRSLEQQAAAENPRTSQEAAPASSGLQKATLYNLLVAELAGQRGMPQVRLNNYLREARNTGDPGLARQAAELARDQGNLEALVDATHLWIQAQPDATRAYRLAAVALLEAESPQDARTFAMPALAREDTETAIALAKAAENLSDSERLDYRNHLEQLLQTQPDNALWLYARAALLQHQEDLTPALETLDQALAANPELAEARLLQVQLLIRAGQRPQALEQLAASLDSSRNRALRTVYLRLLLEAGNNQKATHQAQQLINNHPGDHNLKFLVAALLLEGGQHQSAKTYFSELDRRLGGNSPLNYYLGRIALEEGDQAEALARLSQVVRPPYLRPSLIQIGRILPSPSDRDQLTEIYAHIRQQAPKAGDEILALEAAWLEDKDFKSEAMSVYTQALEGYPEHAELRYNRAMLAVQTGDLELMEKDLRHLIERDPTNAAALNALGYTLTERTQRHREALGLIRRALELKPEDPAILDSMGWVHFNLGQPRRALDYLQRAHERLDDPEIATHLGQVYWHLGEQEKALVIWRDALERHPDNHLLLDAIKEARPDAVGI